MSIEQVNEFIYNSSDGKLGINRNNQRAKFNSEELTKAGMEYATKPIRTSENTFFENSERLHKVSNAMSLVISDYATRYERARYDSIDFSDASIQKHMESIGYGTNAQTAAQNMLNSGFRDAYAPSSASVPSINLGSVSAGEMDALRKTGQLVRNIDGVDKTFVINGTPPDTVMKILNKAHAESERNAKVNAATSKDRKTDAISIIRNAGLSELKNRGIDVGKGTTAELRTAKTLLQSEISLAKMQGDEAKAILLKNDLELLDKHIEIAGGTENRSQHQGRRKAAGKRALQNKILGADLSRGIRTVNTVAKVTAVSAKTVVKLNSDAAFKAGEFVSKHIPKNEKLKALHEGFVKAHQKHGKVRENAKERRESPKAFRERRRNERAERKINRRQRQDDRFNKQQQTLINRGESKRAADRQAKRDRRKVRENKRVQKIGNIKGSVGNFREKFGKFKTKISNSKVVKFIKTPFNFIGKVKDAIRNFILKKIAIPVACALGGVLLIALLLTLLMVVYNYISHFLSEGIQTNLVGQLNNINYVQLIVDDVSETLGNGFLDVARKDAERHYLDVEDKKTAVKSNGLEWYKLPTDGELRNIYTREKAYGNYPLRTLQSVNENILPIVSIMHMRYDEELCYEHWLTARAYVYYLYVLTHDIVGYDYEPAPNCKNESLYTGNIIWDVENRSLQREINELCTNVYIHGYDSSVSLAVNQARANADNALNVQLSKMNLPTFNMNNYGVFNEIPYDSEGQCNHFKPVQAGNREGTNKDSENVDNLCGKLQHTHSQACYQLKCTIPVHTHNTGSCDTNACKHTHNSSCCAKKEHTHSRSTCEEKCLSCGKLAVNGKCNNKNCSKALPVSCGILEHKHGFGCDAYKCSHRCNADCCSKQEHTHLSGPSIDYSSLSDENYNTCWHLTCGMPAHLHTAWTITDNNEVMPGCWKTKYICLGHCGGHIIPQIDIEMDYTYKNIAALDNYKTPYFLGETDFNTNIIVNALSIKSISDWKNYWNNKMVGWFVPFPTSPATITEMYVKGFILYRATQMDILTNGIANLFSGSTETEIKEEILEDTGEDMFGFEGWRTEDGNLDMDLISELAGYYGSHEDNYIEGRSNWEDFDVLFPVGNCRPLSYAQKESILQQVEDYNFDISNKRKQLISQALDSVGYYWYDLSTQMSDIKSTSGRINSAGFVSSVIYNSLGVDNSNWTERDYALNGYPITDNILGLMPGDILTENKKGYWELGKGWINDENNTIIFIGRLKDGIEDFPNCGRGGYYIIDCSEGAGGATIRKVNQSFLNKYKYKYNKCY